MVSEKMMIKIRKMYFEQHQRVEAIAYKTTYSVCTIYKYLKPEYENYKREKRKITSDEHNLMDEYIPIVKSWLEQDRYHHYKQRHTAKRVFDRLCEECPDFNSSLRTVERVYSDLAEEIFNGAANIKKEIFIPGDTQIGCFITECIENGKHIKMYALIMLFLYSRAAYIQLIRDKNPECTLKALQNIYNYLNGIPPYQKFIPSTNLVVYHNGEPAEINSELFLRFRMFYCFRDDYFPSNYESKITPVGASIGYYKLKVFGKDIPEFESLEEYSKTLFKKCEDTFDRNPLHNPLKTVRELFVLDKAALLPLPDKSFNVISWKKRKVDHVGQVFLDKKHSYFLSPEFCNRTVYIVLSSDKAEILNLDHTPIITFPRDYCAAYQGNTDWVNLIPQIIRRPHSIKNLPLFSLFPDALKEFVKASNSALIKEYLSALQELVKTISLEDSIYILAKACRLNLKSSDEILAMKAQL